jgi:hypothetical protein
VELYLNHTKPTPRQLPPERKFGRTVPHAGIVVLPDSLARLLNVDVAFGEAPFDLPGSLKRRSDLLTQRFISLPGDLVVDRATRLRVNWDSRMTSPTC